LDVVRSGSITAKNWMTPNDDHDDGDAEEIQEAADAAAAAPCQGSSCPASPDSLAYYALMLVFKDGTRHVNG
jgi:hypothetical protein